MNVHEKCAENIEKALDVVTGMTRTMRRKDGKWLAGQNALVRNEAEILRRRTYHRLHAKHPDVDRSIVSMAAFHVATRSIRERYWRKRRKNRTITIDHVPNEVDMDLRRLSVRTSAKPAMNFLLQRIAVIRECRENGVSYRKIADYLNRKFPRKKVKISHTSIMNFCKMYLVEEKER